MSIHEPEFVKDSKNAIGYFVIMAFCTIGLGLVLAAMFAPFFLPAWFRKIDADEEAALDLRLKKSGNTKKTNGGKLYHIVADTKMMEKRRSDKRYGAVIFTMFWFIVSWGLFIIAALNSKGR